MSELDSIDAARPDAAPEGPVRLQEVKDPYSPELGDWRLHFTGWIVLPADQDPTQEQRAGRMTTHRENDLEWVSFQTPNASALHLNSAWKAALRATKSKPHIVWIREPMRFSMLGPGQKGAAQLSEVGITPLFDFLEDAMVAVTSSFAALEAFANLTLVEHATGPITLKLRGKTQTLDIPDVERRVSTGQKLDELVPPLLGVATPSGLPEWSEFKRLQEWRDSITHFKRRDLANPNSHATVLHHLIDLRPFEAPRMAEALLRHFYSSGLPRYMVLAPWRAMEAECMALEAAVNRHVAF